MLISSYLPSKLSDAFIETSKSSKLSAINLEDVIVIVSDVDEVPCADKLAWLKYCDIPSDALPAQMEPCPSQRLIVPTELRTNASNERHCA
jgi:hypothetical protein